jgi:hypothetical protein
MTTQGTETRQGQDLQGLGAKHDGPFGAADAPQPTDNAETIMTDVQQAVPVAGEDAQCVADILELAETLRVAGNDVAAIRNGIWNDEPNDLGRLLSIAARHRLAALSRLTEPARKADRLGDCTASPDHADIMETIQDAADDWQAKGYTSALAEVRDMAAVGRSLMEALPKGYCYMDSPAEIVCELQNELDEARALTPTDPTHTREAEGEAIAAFLNACAVEADRQSALFADQDRSICDGCRQEAKAYRNAARMIEGGDHASYRALFAGSAQ